MRITPVNLYFTDAAVNLPMHETSWDPQSACLPGSQKAILNEITRWAISRDPEAPIFLLVGPPGCGKTRIANSTAVTFDNGGRLGASVFLDRDIAEHKNPTKIFSSIARELAAFDDQLKFRISRAVSLRPGLGTAVLERQLQGLIIEPLHDLTIIGPILIIIDGLDVWQDRHRVLSALQNADNLPSNLRILITSRPEDDIVDSLKDIPHCHQRRMMVDEEGLVMDVADYSHQCLKILQDIKPSIFADSSVEEVIGYFETKSRGIYLWVSVAIRYLAVVSDDTARAFLSVIDSAEMPPDYVTAMSILKQSIDDSLKATSRVKLKSELSVGAAMALGVTGLRSDKAVHVLKAMFDKHLLKYDDNASRFLLSIRHPSWTDAAIKNCRCPHPPLESGSTASNVCMAHVCVDFLSNRLSSDICSSIYQVKNHGESMIDMRLWKQPPYHLRPYVVEAYRYAIKFSIEHLKDVQDDCSIPSIEKKLRNLTKHFYHLSEYLGKDGPQMTEILEKYLDMLDDSVSRPYTLTFATFFQRVLQGLRNSQSLIQAKDHLDKFQTVPEGCSGYERWKWKQSLSENWCVCTQYHAWKITSPNICSLKACLEYTGNEIALHQCLMVTPPIIPMIDKDGQVCRTIGEVNLTVDRTASGKLVHNKLCTAFIT